MKKLGNIRIEKIWEDDSCFEIKLSIESEFVSAWQTCYFDAVSFNELSSFINDYCIGECNSNYYESGDKQGNSTPSFSMCLRDDSKGHVVVEMDLEINDVEDRTHRCVCNVYSELGLLEQFAKRLSRLVRSEIGFTVSLLDK